MKINWKNESTWAAIGGGLIAILTGTGLLVGDEGAAASAVVANLSAGFIGLALLIRSIRNRIKSPSEDTQE